MEATEAVASYGGAARWKPLLDKGVTDGRLRAAVRSGDLVRKGPVFALANVRGFRSTGTRGVADHASEGRLDAVF